jgi:hypothetical protein
MDVDAIRHDVNSIGRNSASLEDAGHGAGDGDNRRSSSVFPARSGIGVQWKIDTACNDHGNSGAKRRDGRNRHGVRGVGVYDVDCAFSHCHPQAPRGSHVGLGRRTALYDVEARRSSALGQRFAAARRDGRGVASTRELEREPERLALSAAPASLGVDMHHSESHGAQHPSTIVRTQVSRGRRGVARRRQ